MTKRDDVYKCEKCGNLIGVIHGAGGDLVCCGENMVLLKANSTDASAEKHVPIITQDPQYLSIGGRMVFGFTFHSLLLIYFSFEWLRKHQILKINGGQKEWTIRLISKKERV